MKTPCRICLLILLLALSTGSSAQLGFETERRRSPFFRRAELDTNYVQTYKNQLLYAFIGTRKFQHVAIESLRGADRLFYKPNNPYSFGAALSFNSFSIDLTMKFPYLTKDYKKKGESDIFRVRLGYNKPKVWMSTMVQFIHGFYLDNIEKFDPEWFDRNDSYLLRPDIINLTWYTAAFYSLNHRKITYQSSIGWEQRQKKSAGTFLIGGSALVNYLAADSSIIPGLVSEQFSDNLELTEQLNLQFGLSIGYVHAFMITPKVYFSIGVFPGLHYQIGHHIAPLTGKQDISGDIGSITEGRASFGYNTEKFYAGVTFNEIFIMNYPKYTVLTNGYAHLKFFVGKRLDFKKWRQSRKNSNERASGF